MSTSARVTTRVTSRSPATPPAVSRRPIRTDIQGLRALAIILVLLNHAGAPFAAGGFVGVDVFFVISGFLISTHLLESLHNTGRIHFLRFYVARARRILPAALVTIAATAVASFFVVSPLRITEILHDGIAAALYVPNVVFAVRETNYLAGTAPSPFQHFWSLGVEEQFYLVWPVLLFALFVLTRGSRRRMPLMLTGVGVIAVATCVAGIVATADAPSLAFFSPHTRAWEFAVGALIAGAAPTLKLVPTYLAHALSWVGLVLVVIPAVAYSAATHYPGWAALLPVIGTATVIAFGTSASGRAAPSRGAVAILGLRPLQFIGAISYSLYLVHWPIVTLVHEHVGLGQPLPLAAGLLLAALSIP
ncbi:MAG: hypothetical protein JWQ43_1180, partial [Glaciihabitans sp.]|nr:hypothetical protein [Glaciihabitans sp.]